MSRFCINVIFTLWHLRFRDFLFLMLYIFISSSVTLIFLKNLCSPVYLDPLCISVNSIFTHMLKAKILGSFLIPLYLKNDTPYLSHKQIPSDPLLNYCSILQLPTVSTITTPRFKPPSSPNWLSWFYFYLLKFG